MVYRVQAKLLCSAISPRRDRGSVSVHENPAPEVNEGAAPLMVRTALIFIANPLTAAQLSLIGRMLVWMKRPPDWENTSNRHLYQEWPNFK